MTVFKRFHRPLALLQLLLASVTFAGNEGSGGGDSERSSAVEVEFQTSGAAGNVVTALTDSKGLGDAKANAMAKQIRESVDLSHVRNGTGYFLSNEPCFDKDSATHMGGAVIGDTGRPFCLSVPLLQKLPPRVLFEQIMALMAHELAHQAGYEEADALHLQNWALQRARNASAAYTVVYIISRAKESIAQAREAIRSQAPASRTCGALGSADAFIETILSLAGFYSYTDLFEPIHRQITDAARAAGRVKFAPLCAPQAGGGPAPGLIERMHEAEIQLDRIGTLWSK
jgi:hypothetical protein